ncbi:hypothetical protein GLE_3456 [Lysobacter enzymogenes]|uniref:Uncharacterized protein n=1 Tax=Lysobacter enzymogenes TaxID=69 RepID=A0A0S2DK60_LYSEN|nr:hypothetical protein GLE_3456 [Lysobacter enzymogenes]
MGGGRACGAVRPSSAGASWGLIGASGAQSVGAEAHTTRAKASAPIHHPPDRRPRARTSRVRRLRGASVPTRLEPLAAIRIARHPVQALADTRYDPPTACPARRTRTLSRRKAASDRSRSAAAAPARSTARPARKQQ